MQDEPFITPSITDDDVRAAARMLGFSENAFHGEDGNDPRAQVLKNMSTADIQACPGSGKTTLLVAKLAILANKWTDPTRGICVLSHTNAARQEIESRLGSNPVGAKLLSFPHFIGTIHGFVDNYLGLPWLRSNGYPLSVIDNEICLARRWRFLPHQTRSVLERNRHKNSVLVVNSMSFDLGEIKIGKNFMVKENPPYQGMQDVCRRSFRDGYFCYGELFISADDLLDFHTSIVQSFRSRFPLVFIDEAQDNSEEQSSMLHRLFLAGENPVNRQRFGDSNQAIYSNTTTKDATTDKFPSGTILPVPNSHRFGSDIAKMAHPLAINQTVKLTGNGPSPFIQLDEQEANRDRNHTIFLFDEDSIENVFSSYAQLLLKEFPSEATQRAGRFSIVGQTHKNNGDDKKPRHVGQYWPNYDAELSKSDPQPQTFIQYVKIGQAEAGGRGEFSPACEKIAQGMLRLVKMAGSERPIYCRRNSHRYILELLGDDGKLSDLYLKMTTWLCEKPELLTQQLWNEQLCKCVKKIAEGIAGKAELNTEAVAFLEWIELSHNKGKNVTQEKKDNIFRYPPENPKIDLHVGSIHSVKGQTHTATLILETYYKKHHLDNISDWLSGERNDKKKLGKDQLDRLKLGYVAMTRPTHLICLAMQRVKFENDGVLDQEKLTLFNKNGWRFEDITASNALGRV
tara:strand:+ start:527 stop:2575 length:2049 start_codon:yes stop_codon:yes gene_type:complete